MELRFIVQLGLSAPVIDEPAKVELNCFSEAKSLSLQKFLGCSNNASNSLFSGAALLPCGVCPRVVSKAPLFKQSLHFDVLPKYTQVLLVLLTYV